MKRLSPKNFVIQSSSPTLCKSCVDSYFRFILVSSTMCRPIQIYSGLGWIYSSYQPNRALYS